MTPAKFFTRADGTYHFARWARAWAPVVFGVSNETLALFHRAFQALSKTARHPMAETDPEFGANIMIFFARSWDEYRDLPNLDAMIPDLEARLTHLDAHNANQYRVFRFDDSGAIKAAFVLLRMDEALMAQPAQVVALSQALMVALLWAEAVFEATPPLQDTAEGLALRPEIAALLCAAYDPVMPLWTQDPSHALRLAARLSQSDNSDFRG